MFIQRIEIPTRVEAKPRPKALKLGAGLLFLAASAIAMPVWLGACACWFAGAALLRFPRTAWRTTIWAGELVVGR
jgi:hypothetical protein